MLLVAAATSLLLAEAKLGPSWRELDGYTFEQYKVDFSRRYADDAEEAVHRQAFEENLAKVMEHNADTSKTWRMGVNHLTDRPPHHLKQLHGYHKPSGMLRRSGMSPAANGVDSFLEKPHKAFSLLDRFTRAGAERPNYPYEVDWRKDGVVTAVKNQGQCGSCWAFAATESIESALAIATGELYVLSVQEFVSCAPNEDKCGGSGGCGGSIAQLAFDYARDAGITEEWSYPYFSFYGDSGNKDKCSVGGDTGEHHEASQGPTSPTSTVRVGEVTGHFDLPTNDQDALMQAIAFQGPVSVSVDASAWHFYEEGIFDGCNQTHPDLDHAVQLVGYGTDAKDGDYWLVRNSWSPMWGERGYIRLRRETTPRCGTDVTPDHGTGCKGGPPTQEVCGTCGILFDNTIPIIRRKAAQSSRSTV